MEYKEYEKKGYKYFDYSFDGLQDLQKFILNNEPKADWGELASQSGDFHFTGTRDFEEAMQLCFESKAKEIGEFVSYNDNLKQALTKTTQKRNFKDDVYGGRVKVSKVLTGNPRSMQRLIRNEPLKYVSIYVNCACKAITDKESIENRGVIITNLINLLEQNRYKVDLNFYFLAMEESGRFDINNEIIYIKINIKRPGEKLDLSSTYFPLCHPSFLRRILFSVIERIKDLRLNWSLGYGVTIDDIKRFIDINEKESVVFPQPEHLGIKGNNIYEDTISIFECSNIGDFIAPGKVPVYDDNIKKIKFIDDDEEIIKKYR